MGRDITEYVCYGALIPDVREPAPKGDWYEKRPLMSALDDDMETLEKLGLQIIAYSDGDLNVLAVTASTQRCEDRFYRGRVEPLLKIKFPENRLDMEVAWAAQIREYLQGFVRMMMHIGDGGGGLTSDRLEALKSLSNPEIGWWAGFEDSY